MDEFEPKEYDFSEPVVEIPTEVVSDTKVVKDPKYFYYVNSDGDIARKLKGGTRKTKPKKITNYFDKFNLTVPKILLNGYVSKKFKTVRATGPKGGMIWVPGIFIGKEFQVILIPKEDWILGQIGN